MRLEHFLHPDRTVVLSGVTTPDELLKRLAETASTAGVDAGEVERALHEREGQAATSTPEGVAFPHALLDGVGETIVVAARAPEGVSMGKGDHPPSDIVFCMVGSAKAPWDHVRLLARLARIARGSGALERIRKATDGRELFDTLVSEDRAHG